MSTTQAPGKAITITRVFDAPREIVWKAWTTPENFMRWWGPKDFTAPYCAIDLRVGGRYLNAMRSPDGSRDYWTTGVYRELAEPERIVYTDSFADKDGNVVAATHYDLGADFPLETLVTVMLEDLGGKTRMTLTHEGIPAGATREGTETGWSESFDKLAATLA